MHSAYQGGLSKRNEDEDGGPGTQAKTQEIKALNAIKPAAGETAAGGIKKERGRS